MEKNIIDAIETKLGYEFSNKALLIQAFTRESYAKEQRVKGVDCQSNEQLEYFGDSVLNYLVVCGQLDHFTKIMDGTGLHVLYKEGKLSEFNSHWTDKTMLSECIDALGFAKYLIMSKGDVNQKANENKSVKEDLFESLVGAMWIDSNKNVDRIQSIVYSMLNITFESANVEKNYYSQFMEHADKNKCRTVREVTELDEGFEVKLGINMEDYLGDEGAGIWCQTGYGKNIKEAESDAARKLIEALRNYNFFDKKMPNVNFDIDNSINVLQELNQKGYIGEVSYSDEACFTSERKPYWKVTCKIANYVVNFVGADDSKKIAKKKAAFDALVFITTSYNREDSNPQDKQFRFLLNTVHRGYEMSVFIIDEYSEFKASGTLFPENKRFEVFMVNDEFEDDNGDRIELYDDPEEFLYQWMLNDSRLEFDFWEENGLKELRMFVHEEYEKLPENIKHNGVILKDVLVNVAEKWFD